MKRSSGDGVYIDGARYAAEYAAGVEKILGEHNFEPDRNFYDILRVFSNYVVKDVGVTRVKWILSVSGNRGCARR